MTRRSRITLFFIFFSLITSNSFGAINIIWDTESPVSGYHVHYGTSPGHYQYVTDVKSADFVLPNSIFDGKTYYFAVAAYDAAGNESVLSEELSTLLPNPSTDTDKDGVTDYMEIFYNKTDPANPVDNIPISNAGPDQTVNPGEVILSGEGTDPNNDLLTFLWTSQPSVTITNCGGNIPAEACMPIVIKNPTSKTASFLAVQDGAYNFTLTVTDINGGASSDSAVITVNNIPPTADAGTDVTVDTGTTARLYGTGTDANNDPLTFEWSIQTPAGIILPQFITTADIQTPAGIILPLSILDASGNASQFSTDASPLFTPDKAGIYSFSLIVIDDNNARSSAKIVHVISNNIPTANAGSDYTVLIGENVILDGSASTGINSTAEITYSWKSEYPFTGAETANPSFSTTTPGIYLFSLTVTSGGITSLPDSTIVTVNDPPYYIPVADAGDDQSVKEDELVQLGGARSSFYNNGWQTDPCCAINDSANYNNLKLTYLWTQISGTWVQISDITAINPSFTPASAGVYEFQLVVNDGKNNSLPDSVIISVEGVNHLPIANAGDDQQNILIGTTVFLHANASSDQDNDKLAYFWTQLSGPMSTLSDPNTVAPYFTPLMAGIYEFELRVNDGIYNSQQTNSSWDNPAAVNYNSQQINTSRDNTAAGHYSVPDSVIIAVESINSRPTASAGADITAATNDLVTLDGSASGDADGDAITFHWVQKTGAILTLEGADTPKLTFTPKAEGSYTFMLTTVDIQTPAGVNLPQSMTVNDNLKSLPDIVTVYVSDKVFTQKLITASEGGTIISDAVKPGGIQIEIQPGGLYKDSLVSIGESSMVTPFPDTIQALTNVVNIEPSGTGLSLPAKITFFIGDINPNSIVVKRYNASTREWKNILADKGPGYVTVTVYAFSKLAVGSKTDAYVPADDSSVGGCGFVKPTNNHPGSGGIGFMLALSPIILVPLFRKVRLS